MRTDLLRIGNVVQFKHGNGVHTGTIKTVGRNGNDEMGSEVVIGDIYPHIYNQPTVTMHGLDLLALDRPGFRQVTNERAYSERDLRTRYVDDPRLSPEQNQQRRDAQFRTDDGRGYPGDGGRFGDGQRFTDGQIKDGERAGTGHPFADGRPINEARDLASDARNLPNMPEPVVNR